MQIPILIWLKVSGWLTTAAFVLQFTCPSPGSYYIGWINERGWAENVDVRYVTNAGPVEVELPRDKCMAIYTVAFLPYSFVDFHSGESH